RVLPHDGGPRALPDERGPGALPGLRPAGAGRDQRARSLMAMSGGATLALVRVVRGIRGDEIPPDALEVARHCLLDFLGCALAGSREPLTDILVASVAQDGAPATLIGRRERAPWVGAALVNGAAGHALDL